VLVPSQREIPRTVTQGTPIVTAQPRSTAAKAFRSLASLYTNGSADVETAAAERSWQPSLKLLLRRA
jgi:MinD-like ATPase involved in chromosome partitioning or flagellar assembly